MKFKIKAIALAVGFSAASLTLPAYALTITSTVQTSSSITQNGDNATQNSGPGVTASSLVNQTPNFGYVGESKASGNNNGFSELRSEGLWYYGGQSSYQNQSVVTHTATIFNDDAFAQTLNFDFLITAGHLSTGAYNSGSVSMQVGYTADISLNGQNLFFSAAEVTTNSVTLNGTSLNGTQNSFFNGREYSWNNYSDNLSLGTIGAGETITLSYELTTYVNEEIGASGYSYQPEAVIGDPFDFNSNPLFDEANFNAQPANNVPGPSPVDSPATAAMLGLGLAGLAFRRKSRKANA